MCHSCSLVIFACVLALCRLLQTVPPIRLTLVANIMLLSVGPLSLTYTQTPQHAYTNTRTHNLYGRETLSGLA